MKVKLRERQKGNKIRIYLEYYHKGKRKYEYLPFSLYPEPDNGNLPKSKVQENKKIRQKAEKIWEKRKEEAENHAYGLRDLSKHQASFIEYMRMLAEKRNESSGNYGNWGSALLHLQKYINHDVTFAQIDKKFVEGFKDYLLHEGRTKSDKPLSQNSCYSYFNKFKAALKQAVRDGILHTNPAEGVDSIKQDEPQREFLTQEELQKLAQTECDAEVLKNAFLFSALTGIRWSDIQKLTWSDIQHSEQYGHYIRFRQKKTKGAETLPISNQARNLLGEREASDERVFKGLKYSAWYNLKLKQWVMRAGIDKEITFHCARHTYATLQLTKGTDIYTVSKLLGHKNLKTTQVYARIIDEKKREAANKIDIEL